jgi:hypothetical protein
VKEVVVTDPQYANSYNWFTAKFYHTAKVTKIQIEPCEFIWKVPPPRAVNAKFTSKNRARMASGKRNGNRKSRKRGADGLVRQPNDWIIPRVLESSRACEYCSRNLFMYARKVGNRKNRIVLFNSWENNRVLYTLWFLRREMQRMYGFSIPSDVAHIITFHAFSRNIISGQQRRRDQFHAPCGCTYHIDCYGMYTLNKSICRAHKKAFP